MTNDDLLVKIGALAREQEAELSRLPAQPPLSGEERQAIAEAALAALPVRAPAPGTAVGRFRWWWPRLAIPALVACALLLVIRPGTSRHETPPLPGYTATIEGGVESTRGVAPAGELNGAVQRITRRSVLTVVATPAVDVSGEVGARAFLGGGERARELSVRPEIAPSGSVRVEVTGLADLLDPGATGQLRVVVGRPEALAKGTPADGPELRSFTFVVLRASE